MDMDIAEESANKHKPWPPPSPSPSPTPNPPSCDNDPFAEVLPCSTSLGGSLVLLALWSYILCKGGMLMQHAGRSWFKGSAVGKNVVLPILEAVPNGVVVLLAGLMTTPDTREHIAVGVGTMAGSSVLLLTMCWGSAVLAGRTELSLDGVMIAKLLREPFDLIQTGISTDSTAPKAASIMLASASLYLTIEIPSLLNFHHLRWLLGLTSLLCMGMLVAYCSHQVLAPIAARKADIECRLRHLRFNTVRSISYYANRYGGILLPGDHKPNVAAVERIFQRFDRDRDGRLSREELCALLVALEFCPSPPHPSLLSAPSLSPASLAPSQSTTPHVIHAFHPNGNGSSSSNLEGRSLTERPSSPELEQLRSKLVAKSEAQGGQQQQQPPLSPEQQQAEQQRSLFQARYGHVEHVAENWLRQWGGLRSGGVTLEAFNKNLMEWFAEKEKRFVVDFPHAKPPKAVKKAGASQFWVYTYKAPDDYHELLLQHKAKLDAAVAGAAAAAASAPAGGAAAAAPSGAGLRGWIAAWKQKATHRGLREPLLKGGQQGDEEQGFSFREKQQEPSAPSTSLQARAQPSALPQQQQQRQEVVAGLEAAAEASAAAQEDESTVDGRSSSSLQVVADGGASPTQQLPAPSRSHSTRALVPHSCLGAQRALMEGGAESPSRTSSMADLESSDLLALEEENALGSRMGSEEALWEAARCCGFGVLGFLMCLAFAGPFIRTTAYAGAAMGVRPFLVAFLAGPLASHAPGILNSVQLAASKHPRSLSVALGQVYGAVTMINTLVLGVLLGIMATQHIRWRYTGELIIALLPTLLVGSVGASSRTIYTLWGLVALAAYPAVVFLCWIVRTKLK